MDGSIDIKLLLTLGGVLFSIAGASAIAKQQIKSILDTLKDLEQRMRALDARTDRQETSTKTQVHRIDILSKMMSPDNLKKEHYEVATMLAKVDQLKEDVKHLSQMHNGIHPPVANTRKAEE